MSPFEVTIGLTKPGKFVSNTAGQVTSYPFDRYQPEFGVEIAHVAPNGIDIGEPVTTNLEFTYAAHGFTIDTPTDTKGPLRSSDVGEVPYTSVIHTLDLHIRRAPSTVFFAVFLMILMWLLTIAIVTMAVILTFLHHDIGPGVLGFLAAILFAFPALRAVSPGAPPPGSLSDFLAFFWCEGIIAITLDSSDSAVPHARGPFASEMGSRNI